MRLIVERVEADTQARDESDTAWLMPVRADVRLVRSVWTDGTEALEEISIDGACELTLSVYAYAGSPIIAECQMKDGSTAHCECVVGENGDVTLQLDSIPVQVEIRLNEAV